MDYWLSEPDKDRFIQKHRWETRGVPDFGMEINHYINNQLRQVTRIEEEVLTTTVVEALRAKGYTVIAPTKETN